MTQVMSITWDETTGELVASQGNTELARVVASGGGNADEVAQVAREAANTLTSWYV